MTYITHKKVQIWIKIFTFIHSNRNTLGMLEKKYKHFLGFMSDRKKQQFKIIPNQFCFFTIFNIFNLISAIQNEAKCSVDARIIATH